MKKDKPGLVKSRRILGFGKKKNYSTKKRGNRTPQNHQTHFTYRGESLRYRALPHSGDKKLGQDPKEKKDAVVTLKFHGIAHIAAINEGGNKERPASAWRIEFFGKGLGRRNQVGVSKQLGRYKKKKKRFFGRDAQFSAHRIKERGP